MMDILGGVNPLPEMAKRHGEAIDEFIIQFFGTEENARKKAHLYELKYESGVIRHLDDGTLVCEEVVTIKRREN